MLGADNLGGGGAAAAVAFKPILKAFATSP